MMAGPDPVRPWITSAWLTHETTKFMMGVVQLSASLYSPAAAVPVSAKMPVPMMAPMPRQVRSSAPRERFILRSGSSDSCISSSGLFVFR